jgi:hypothetical protein
MVRTFCLRLTSAAFISALSVIAGHAAEPIYPTGSRIGLEPARGLSASERFPGFEDKASGATVLILDMPAQALSEAAKQINKDALKKQGIVEDTRENFSHRSGKGTLVAGRQEGDSKVRKWILLTSVFDSTTLIVVEVPDDAAKSYSDPVVRTMLSSLTMRASVPIGEQMKLLPLRFTELSGMRPVRVIASTGAILTNGPKDTLEPSEQPLLIVSIGRGGPDEPAARDIFARNLFAGTGQFKDMRIIGTEILRLGGGLQTHQLFAEARDAKTETPIKLVQWIRFGSGAYVRIVGIARADEWSDAFPRFRAVRDGVNPRG